MRVVQGVLTGKSKVTFPVVVNRMLGEIFQNAQILHGCLTAFGVQAIKRQAIGTGCVKPMQLSLLANAE